MHHNSVCEIYVFRTTQRNIPIFIRFGVDLGLQSKLHTFQAFTLQSTWVDAVRLLLIPGVREEPTARSESETDQNAFCLDVQGRAGVVGVMAFAEDMHF